MGTCSKPLFGVTSHLSASECVIPLTACRIDGFDIAYRSTPHMDITKTTLEDFMKSGCSTLKIIDELTDEKRKKWIILSEVILMENSCLEWIQFHFQCVDDGFPYYLEYTRIDRELFLYYIPERLQTKELRQLFQKKVSFHFLNSLIACIERVDNDENDYKQDVDIPTYKKNMSKIPFKKVTTMSLLTDSMIV